MKILSPPGLAPGSSSAPWPPPLSNEGARKSSFISGYGWIFIDATLMAPGAPSEPG
jgi:hypothetical protein